MAGYRSLMQNVELTTAQDPGFVTEVISGAFFEPLGRSSSHQMWSSAMTLAPTVRGMFGLEADGLRRSLAVEPRLPAAWDHVELEHVRVGDELLKVEMRRERGRMVVTVAGERESVLCLNLKASAPCTERAAKVHRVELPLPAVEMELIPQGLPMPGSATAQARVTDEVYEAGGAKLTLEAIGGSTVKLVLRRNDARMRVNVDGVAQRGDAVAVVMPAGDGFVSRNVQIRWLK
jgi:hypothetical protein